MMEKELKISELAAIWRASVPTTWNRIKKMGLTTFIKKNENNKDINYIRISDEQINEYVIKDVNNHNKEVNNVYYEDMLTNNNVYKDVNNVDNNSLNTDTPVITPNSLQETIETLTSVNNVYNERLMKVYDDYNNRLQRVNDELIDYKSKTLLLEDKANREGLYIKEINELKAENNRNKHCIYILIALLVILLLGLTGYLTYNITVNNALQPLNKVEDNVKK